MRAALLNPLIRKYNDLIGIFMVESRCATIKEVLPRDNSSKDS